jgi:hypothetical protein
MTPRESFLEAAAATAAPRDHEFQRHFRAELERLTLEAGDEPLLLASKILSQPGDFRRRKRSRRTGIILAILAILACLAFPLRQAFLYRGEIAYLAALLQGNFITYDPGTAPNLPAPGTRQHRLLLGDPGKADTGEQFYSLWQDEPRNPAFLRAYVTGRLRLGGGGLPPDFVETARRIDPGNGYFLLLAAAETSKTALKRSPVSTPPKADEIIDPDRLDEALGCFHEAVSRSRLHDPSLELAAERFQALPTATDYLSNLSTLFYMASAGSTSSGAIDLGRALGAAAQQDWDTKDVESFKLLCSDCQTLNRMRVEDQDQSLFHLLVEEAGLSVESKIIGPIAGKFKLEDEAYFSTLSEQLAALRGARKQERAAMDLALLQQKGNSLIGAPLFPVKPVPTLVELAPGRLTEHALLQRFLTLVSCAILLAAVAAISVYPYRSTALVRSLGDIAVCLTPDGDVLAASFFAIIPILGVQAWIWSPYGSSAWAPFWGGISLGALANLAGLLLALLLPLIMIRRRLGKALTPLGGFQPGNRWIGWIAATCGFGALGLMGAVPFLPGFESLFGRQFNLLSGVGKIQLEGTSGIAISTTLCLLGFLALYLVAAGLRALLSSRERLLRRFVISKLLLAPYLAAACTLALLQPALHACEKHWFNQDPFSKVTLDHPKVDGFEAHIMTPAYQTLRDAVAAAEAKIPH